jgi:hypothetical protein
LVANDKFYCSGKEKLASFVNKINICLVQNVSKVMKGLHSQVYINLGNLKYAYNYLGFDHLGS